MFGFKKEDKKRQILCETFVMQECDYIFEYGAANIKLVPHGPRKTVRHPYE